MDSQRMENVIETKKKPFYEHLFEPDMAIWLYIFLWLFLGIFAISGYDPYANAERITPEALNSIKAPWVYNIVIPVVAIVYLIYFIRSSAKKKTLSWWLLFGLSSLSIVWGETIGDWGVNITWNPVFPSYNGLPFETFPWHTQDIPFWMPFSYLVFWSAHAFVMFKACNWVKKKTGWAMWKVLLIAALPVEYLVDFATEGLATFMGWWQYEPPVGPYLSWSFIGGLGNMPLLVPIIYPQILFPTIMAFLGQEGEEKKNIYQPGKIERIFRLERLLPDDHPGSPNYVGDINAEPTRFAWKYELARIAAWFSTFGWLYIFTMLFFTTIGRYIFSSNNPICPYPTLPEGASLTPCIIYTVAVLVGSAIFMIVRKSVLSKKQKSS